MPYGSTSELPSSVRDKYSSKCQRAYMHAFNSVHENTGDEGRAAAAGHSAAQKCEGNKSMDINGSAIADTLAGGKFQIFSGILKASRSADGRMRLHGVASSTTKDLHGDTMDPTALEDMERAANNNLTIFLNHSYNVPEDVAGSVERARLATRGADHTGNPNYDLDLDILVNHANPRAVKAFEAIEGGTKLGLSIGALIPDGGAIRDKKSGSYMIQHVELLETSLVGIPANPRSWVEYAVKSLKSTERVNDAIDASAFGDVTNTYLAQSAEAPEEEATPEITKADTCPTCGKSRGNGGDCADSFHSKSVEPEVTDAQVTIIQIDTENDSDVVLVDAPQEGPTTDPDGEFASVEDEAVTVTADVGPLTEVLALLRTTTGELVTTKSENAALQVQLAVLQGERDSAVKERDDVLKGTREILDRVANAPLVRRAVAAEAQHDLRTRFTGYLSDDLLNMMEK